MVGFVYSLPGIKHGRPTQLVAHASGVLDAYRSAGVGHRLKKLQRERTLAMGLRLVEWTYDPMQALNAHLNFAKLGVVVSEYEVNVYGESSSPLRALQSTRIGSWPSGTWPHHVSSNASAALPRWLRFCPWYQFFAPPPRVTGAGRSRGT